MTDATADHSENTPDSFNPALFGSKAKVQSPLRFCHCGRWKSGRGCSGRGIFWLIIVVERQKNAKSRRMLKWFFILFEWLMNA